MFRKEGQELTFLNLPLEDISDIDGEKEPLMALNKTVLEWEELIVHLKERIKCKPKYGLEGVPLTGDRRGELKAEGIIFVWRFWQIKDSSRKFINIKGEWEETNWKTALFALASHGENGQRFYQKNRHAIRCAIVETCQEWKPKMI